MDKIKRGSLLAMGAMAVLSFTNLFGFSIAGAAVLVGVAFFFIDKGRGDMRGSGLDTGAIVPALRRPVVWLWVLLPSLMNLVSLGLSKLVLPDFSTHILARTAAFLSYDMLPLLAVQLVVAALGEEIAWRGFFQRQLGRGAPPAVALGITSVLFALGHVAAGSTAIVAYDLVFIALNSLLYGVVFIKTDNAWVSALSHLVANVVSILLLLLL